MVGTPPTQTPCGKIILKKEDGPIDEKPKTAHWYNEPIDEEKFPRRGTGEKT